MHCGEHEIGWRNGAAFMISARDGETEIRAFASHFKQSGLPAARDVRESDEMLQPWELVHPDN